MIQDSLKKNQWAYNTLLPLLWNMVLAMLSFMLCRVIFIIVNYHMFTNLSFSRIIRMFEGGFTFDLSAVLYTNVLYLVLMLLPIHYKENKLYQQIAKGIFVFANALAIIVNLMDTVFFVYGKRRTTASIFSEFKNEDNLGSIIGTEFLHNWYLVLLAIIMIYGLYKLYKKPTLKVSLPKHLWQYYLVHLLILCAAGYYIVSGMRGGIGKGIRPITISNASKYVESPIETGIVLNTPFAIYRTLGKQVLKVPNYFQDRDKMLSLYSPIHQPIDSAAFTPKNVVILIIESFGKEHSGFLNQDLDNGTYKGYTPFLDSLMQAGLTFQYSFSNGLKSIDAMPSVLASIPRIQEPFILTPASLNNLSGIAGELGKKGYHTAFFHGARDGSMGFDSFAFSTGFDEYYGQKDFTNKDDYDGHWGIWDEPFLQYWGKKMGTFKQPFMSAVFTLSSHHPFKVPEKYEGVFPKGEHKIHQCVGYTDHAIQQFFESIKNEDWYKNTVFVITADHTNGTVHKEYENARGIFSVPIIFFTPDGSLKGFDKEKIVSQMDIMPSVLGYLGYDKPYIAFGQDIFHKDAKDTYTINYLDGIYQIFEGDYLLQFDGENPTGLYLYKTDTFLENNILNSTDKSVYEPMLDKMKSMAQQYMERMVNNDLIIKGDNSK